MKKRQMYVKGLGLLIFTVVCALGILYVTMHDKSQVDASKVTWFDSIASITEPTGKLYGHDKQGLPVILEWKRTSLQDPNFTEITRDVSDIAVQAYTCVETDFLRYCPQAVEQDEYLQPFQPLFKDGLNSVDWNLVQEQQRTKLKAIFTMDVANFAPEVIASLPKDIYFFITISDAQSAKMLGFIQFAIAPYYQSGDVKVITIAVDPTVQNRGLGVLLMSSIFTIIPDIKRIFLSTRPSNVSAIKAYQKWGFIPDVHPVQDPSWKAIENHWIYFEYNVGVVDTLQKMADLLKNK